MLVLVYFDDYIIADNNLAYCIEFKRYMNTHFLKKDVGPLKVFLGFRLLSLLPGYSLNKENIH